MNLLSKLTLLPCAALAAGVVLSGCSSANDVFLSDNASEPAMTETPTNAAPDAPATAQTAMTEPTNDMPAMTEAPSFQAGETVNISTSTGSADNPGPIVTSGQPYLIAEDGTITLPLIGKVQAAGKTPGELQDNITRLYVPAYYVSLAVTVTAPQRVYYVGGEVVHPGPELYNGETTVTKAIQSAGDFTQFASHTVWLTRADGTRIRVKVDKALRDPTQDPPVFPGDQIQVPRRYF